MNKVLNRVLLCISVCITLLILSSCETEEKVPQYTLSSGEVSIVNTIYDCRNIWEIDGEKTCKSIRYVEKNGNMFLLSTYGSTNAGVSFNGSDDVYVSTEVKYTISGNTMHEATAKEYGSNDYGLVTGMVSYNTKASAEEKKIAIAKAVTQKSNVIIP